MTETLLCLGDLARRVNRPQHAVEYAMRTRKIKPSAIVGGKRLFEPRHEQELRAAFIEIDARRRSRASR